MPEYGKVIGVKTPKAPGNLYSKVVGEILRESPKAILFKPYCNLDQRQFGGRELAGNSAHGESPLKEEWFPRSQVSSYQEEIQPDEFSEGGIGYITVKDWLLMEKKWITKY